MKKPHKILARLTALTLMFMILTCSTGALACTGFYVGKDVSANGTYIHGHTADASNSSQTVEIVVEHSEEPGRTFTASGVELALPDVTYQYTSFPDLDFRTGGTNYDEAVANEMGLTMTGATTGYVSDEAEEMDPYTSSSDGAITELWICGYIAATCATVQEALDTYAWLMEEYGSAQANIFIIADQNEAWYVESYTGHQWVAVKCPDDAVAVFGNQFMLGTLEDYEEGVTLVHSDGLYSVPEEAGLAVYDDDGNMDLFATYVGEDNLEDYANLRTWYGHYLLAPSTAGEYETTTRYDLFYTPDDTVSLSDIFALTRSRFEGTEWCPEENEGVDTRVIGIERQANVTVVEVYPDLPAAMSVVTWATIANAEHSVFLPISNLITDVADIYDYIPEDYTRSYDLDLVHVHFKRLCALAEQDRTYYGAGVRDYWESVEASLIEDISTVLAETAELYESDPDAAAESITSWTIDIQEQALEDADTMFEELMWYMIQNTLTYNTSEVTPFVTSLLTTEE